MPVLVICEKPSVARIVAPVLGSEKKCSGYTEGNGYTVSWCYGHLAGLMYPDDYGNNWDGKWNFAQLPMIPDEWKFVITESGKEQYKVLKKLMNSSEITEIVCATDADREGECIFRYVYFLSGCKKPVKRLWISSLEESEIRKGFDNLKSSSEYDNLYSAGFCRVKADWLVGMNASRLFSCRYNQGFNVGRVQTPTLAMIVNRDNDIKNFVKQKYFTINLDCGEFVLSSDRVDNEAEADQAMKDIAGKQVTILKTEVIESHENPPKLYDLTSLQRDANKIYGYTAQQTLDYLQALYEGKLATYPRSDSRYLTEDMKQTALDVVEQIHRIYDFGTVQNPDIILRLLANRLLCACAEPFEFEHVKIVALCESYDFTAKTRNVLNQGWKQYVIRKSDEDEEYKVLPKLESGEKFSFTAEKTEHFTSPPKPYTEDTLLYAMEHTERKEFLKEVEKKGIGTPATRAGTIESLIKRGYAERKGKQIFATEKGVNLIAVVPDEVKSPQLTADWENHLLLVERGEMEPDSFMHEIVIFVKDLCEKYGTEDSSVSFSSSEAAGKCPKCQAEVIKGKYGYYCTAKCGMNLTKLRRCLDVV